VATGCGEVGEDGGGGEVVAELTEDERSSFKKKQKKEVKTMIQVKSRRMGCCDGWK
jgi:hypothetical protein